MTQDFDWRVYLRTFAGSGRPTLPVNTIQLAKNFHKYDRDTQTVTCTLCGWKCTNIEDIEVREIKCPHRKDNNDDDSSYGHAGMERLHRQYSHHEEKVGLINCYYINCNVMDCNYMEVHAYYRHLLLLKKVISCLSKLHLCIGRQVKQ